MIQYNSLDEVPGAEMGLRQKKQSQAMVCLKKHGEAGWGTTGLDKQRNKDTNRGSASKKKSDRLQE